jgi:ribosomal protein S18 acetylase RimI-like enzyme
MNHSIEELTIDCTLRPGDLGYVIYMHGHLYGREYHYGIELETYVAKGIYEFYSAYDESKDRVWIARHDGTIAGFLLLMHREQNSAQLRYFILDPAYRGIGLGKKLMEYFMDFLLKTGYESCYLWTTSELYAAIALYKRYGFLLKEELPSSSFGKAVIEQRYEWRKPV